MSQKELLLAQFGACYDTNAWFVAIRNAIDGVNVEQACWKPADDVNCIWETLSHITYYNYAYLERFKGIDHQYDVSSNNETFSTGEYEEAEWQAAVARFDSVMNEFRDLIASAADERFNQPVSASNPATWATLISNINAHNAHHGGQILLLSKLQGAWNPEKGVS